MHRDRLVDRCEGVLRAVLPTAILLGLLAALLLPWGRG